MNLVHCYSKRLWNWSAETAEPTEHDKRSGLPCGLGAQASRKWLKKKLTRSALATRTGVIRSSDAIECLPLQAILKGVKQAQCYNLGRSQLALVKKRWSLKTSEEPSFAWDSGRYWNRRCVLWILLKYNSLLVSLGFKLAPSQKMFGLGKRPGPDFNQTPACNPHATLEQPSQCEPHITCVCWHLHSENIWSNKKHANIRQFCIIMRIITQIYIYIYVIYTFFCFGALRMSYIICLDMAQCLRSPSKCRIHCWGHMDALLGSDQADAGQGGQGINLEQANECSYRYTMVHISKGRGRID